MATATKAAMTGVQLLIMKKLKTYKTARTSREIMNALTSNGKNPHITSVQQISASLRGLERKGLAWGHGDVDKGLLWQITKAGLEVLSSK